MQKSNFDREYEAFKKMGFTHEEAMQKAREQMEVLDNLLRDMEEEAAKNE